MCFFIVQTVKYFKEAGLADIFKNSIVTAVFSCYNRQQITYASESEKEAERVTEMELKREKKYRIFEIIQVGKEKDACSIAFDLFLTLAICVSLFILLFETFDASEPYWELLHKIEFAVMVFFAAEYGIRIWTADFLYPERKPAAARLSFLCSFYGIVDLFTFLPFFLPVFFPSGIAAFRMLRVIRIFRLFSVNSYYDAFHVITLVLNEKKNQLISSVCLILIMITASSLCMYSLEHEVQPEVFKNAFSGIWWSVSALLTVGYGDIYPITPLGQVMGIIIAFLGVGMVAIPTGIISAGFVEHYTRMQTLAECTEEAEIRFVTLHLDEENEWVNQKICDISLPQGMQPAVIYREKRVLLPQPDTIFLAGDKLVLCAEAYPEELGVTMKQMVLQPKHPWVGNEVRNLDISRRTLIVLVRRNQEMILPDGSFVMEAGDKVVLYTRKDIRGSIKINL